jgi:hypothetical protein
MFVMTAMRERRGEAKKLLYVSVSYDGVGSSCVLNCLMTCYMTNVWRSQYECEWSDLVLFFFARSYVIVVASTPYMSMSQSCQYVYMGMTLRRKLAFTFQAKQTGNDQLIASVSPNVQ